MKEEKDQRLVTVKKRLITEDPKYRKTPYPYAIPWSSSQNIPLTGQDLTVDEATGKTALTMQRKSALELGPTPYIMNPNEIYYIKHSRLFDLSYKVNGEKKEYVSPRDIAEWNCFTLNKEFIAPSKREYNNNKHIFYIQDVEYEAQLDNVELDRQFEAESYVREGSTERWKDILTLLNYEVKEYNFKVDEISTNLLQKYVIEGARKYPEMVLKLKSPNAEALLFTLKVLERGFIEKKKGLEFYCGDEYVGTTIDSVKEYISSPTNSQKVTKWQNQMKPKKTTVNE